MQNWGFRIIISHILCCENDSSLIGNNQITSLPSEIGLLSNLKDLLLGELSVSIGSNRIVPVLQFRSTEPHCRNLCFVKQIQVSTTLQMKFRSCVSLTEQNAHLVSVEVNQSTIGLNDMIICILVSGSRHISQFVVTHGFCLQRAILFPTISIEIHLVGTEKNLSKLR